MTGERFLVSGRVQGVGFRWFVRQRALELGLAGYVSNLPDGQVEVVASGDQGVLELLLRDLQQGPPYAAVAHVEKQEISVEHDQFISFNIM